MKAKNPISDEEFETFSEAFNAQVEAAELAMARNESRADYLEGAAAIWDLLVTGKKLGTWK